MEGTIINQQLQNEVIQGAGYVITTLFQQDGACPHTGTFSWMSYVMCLVAMSC
jgi:hypothetical protein